MWFVAACLALAQVPERPLSPADAVAQAQADAEKLSPDVSLETRYISLYSTPLLERAKQIAVLSGFLNSVSRSPDLVPLLGGEYPTLSGIVPGTQNALVRVYLRDFRLDRKVWDRLPANYFTTQLVADVFEDQEWGYYENGRFIRTKVEKKKTGRKEKQVQALGPWLAETPAQQKVIADLIARTGSKIPVQRLDDFIQQTGIQEGRTVGYYDLLGVKDLKDFEEVIRFNAKTGLDLDQRRVTLLSGITRAGGPRRIQRDATVKGGYWRTFDSAEAIDRKNPARILDDDGFEFEVSEGIAPLVNGMPAYWLGNNKGVRQDKAPDVVIGGNRFGHGNDTRISIHASCVTCHMAVVKEERVVKEINAARFAKLKSNVTPEKYLELRRLYLQNIKPLIDADRANYTAAIKTATGMEPFEYGQEYDKLFGTYAGPVDANRAARDMGVSKAQMIQAFKRYDQATDQLDSALGTLANEEPIGAAQWEEIFGQAMLVYRSVQK